MDRLHTGTLQVARLRLGDDAPLLRHICLFPRAGPGVSVAVTCGIRVEAAPLLVNFDGYVGGSVPVVPAPPPPPPAAANVDPALRWQTPFRLQGFFALFSLCVSPVPLEWLQGAVHLGL